MVNHNARRTAYRIATGIRLVGGNAIGAARGVYLVFASLIIPALAARRFPERMQLAVGYATGIAGYILGLIASALYDWPTGAVIVVALLVVFIAAVLLARAAAPREISTAEAAR